jgi:hypothetical protein
MKCLTRSSLGNGSKEAPCRSPHRIIPECIPCAFKRGRSLVELQYFFAIIVRTASQHAGDEGRTDTELTLAKSGAER